MHDLFQEMRVQEIQKVMHIDTLKSSQESLNHLGLSHCMSVTFITSYIDACEYILTTTFDSL